MARGWNEKIIESQSPEAWGNRIIRVIDTKIVPKLSSEQRQWAAQHQEGIRDAAMYAGVGITTAEIVGGVVALEKLIHLRERLFGFSSPKTIPVERIVKRIETKVIDPMGILVKSVDHMPKGLTAYLRQVVRAGEHSGLDSFGQLGLAATLLTIFANKANPEYAPLFAELAAIAGTQDIRGLQPGLQKLFTRAYEDTAKQFRWDPRVVDPNVLYSHWLQKTLWSQARAASFWGSHRRANILSILCGTICIHMQAPHLTRF